ncbi:MAG: 23S rRNA (pseudouridine(1915)-N(3))-methyltransferase RlmH [Rhodospirillaceae bacterium]|nr:23S rRNA (pseudouridine(1915)-N(3))-methyltransferase RlmH [Rhodospirillaceae bacterium]MBT4905776.1 23S rRNA (pseudouridine(1915)-N(3))-methyltransferase RlmH [Rhodospirillaceae bacterium]MBT5943299.1 23S rRNA (pseudouridine(1915)-N(3))-methyltransferase RlmH [Rhodospirillaceae bacterium]MBT6404811.1 23S rRNA (pseudouridine(1915)-N(3))-methyltransferase RlmH [Rhodospirillaceae bacterium]MBT6536766.1 23S rRNA (pseudouridine(1915)-N(3))-methyltransferase RlmH [Rhodospirillaceae bacterium]
MQILIGAIGRLRAGPEAALLEQFQKRITAWPMELREFELKKKVAADRVSAAEGELLLAAIPDGAHVFVLDETGKLSTSAGIARDIANLQDSGCRNLVFLIGGADGHGDAVRARADRIIAFGRNTWPHMLMRTLLVEQVYRAQQIIARHPYHRA